MAPGGARPRTWRSWLLRVMVTGAVVAGQSVVAHPIPVIADDDSAIVGQWTAPFDLGVIGIHSVLLPNGRVLIYHRPVSRRAATLGCGTRPPASSPT